MQCDLAATMLDAYLDGELPLDQATIVQEHLRTCTRCSSEIAETARMQRNLRNARTHFVPTAEFRRKIQAQISKPKRRSWLTWSMPAGLAVATVLLVAFLWIGHARSSDAYAEFADLHVNALSSTNLVDIVSTDRHTVKPWFQGKIPFSFNLPEFNGTDFSLIGGRMVYFHQQPGAQLIVSMRQHKISVLIFQRSVDMGSVFSRLSTADRRTSFDVQTWDSRQLRFVLVSDAEPAAIDNLGRLLKKVNE